MIVCNLTKPEATLDQVRKMYPDLQHTDAACLAAAIVLAGKYAVAHYDEEAFYYPDDVPNLTKAISREVKQIQAELEPVKKTKAAAAAEEEQPVELKVGLTCNLEEGEKVLGDREDLKTLLSDTIQKGVEYHYGPTDVLWQWALDRANWSTISGGELTRRVKLRATYQDTAVGVDLGTVSGKRKAARAARPVAAAKEEEVAIIEEIDTEEAVPELSEDVILEVEPDLAELAAIEGELGEDEPLDKD